jgi:CHASE3 domain sensor protein
VLQANERQERTAGRAASDVSSAAQQVMNDALNAETGLRGYAATGDQLFLQPYTRTLARVGQDRATLRQAAAAEGDSRQEQAVDAAMTEELAALAQLRSAISAGAPAAALKPALVEGETDHGQPPAPDRRPGPGPGRGRRGPAGRYLPAGIHHRRGQRR